MRTWPRGGIEGESMAAGSVLRICVCVPRTLAALEERVASSCSALSGVRITGCAEDSPGINPGNEA